MKKHTIGVIIGSLRTQRNADVLITWLKAQLAQFEGDLDFIYFDLRDINPPHYTSDKIPAQRAYDTFAQEWSAKIAPCDGFLVLTPEYNHGYPGALKDAFDHLFHEWCFKPIAFIGYGTHGGVRAIEQLRQVAVQLNMAPIRRQIIIPIWDTVRNDNFVAGDRFDEELHEMLRQLQWWATTLASARSVSEPVL